MLFFPDYKLSEIIQDLILIFIHNEKKNSNVNIIIFNLIIIFFILL